MLLPSEFPNVKSELSAALGPYTDPRAQITVIFNAQASSLLQVMPFSANNPEALASWLINYCLNSRWSLAPSMLENLLEWLVTSKGIGALAPILMRVRQKIDPNPGLYATRWVLAAQPFFARHILRGLVKDFVEQNGRSLLRISGPDGSGRSYTSEYFDYLGDQLPGLHIAYAQIASGDAPSCGLKWLGETLAGIMGTKDPPSPTSGSAYDGVLCRWVLQQAMAGGEKWIFVFDGFDQQDVHKDVRSFVQMLAERISKGEYRKRLRLVLIAYDSPITQLPNAVVLSETVPPSTAITQQDVIDCLRELNAQRLASGKLEIDVTQMGTIADSILHRAPANGKERLEFINEQLWLLQSMN